MKTYKIELTINLQGVSNETKLKAKTYWCYLQETISEQMEKLRNLRRQQSINKQEVALPKHNLLCSCRKCEPSTRTFIKRLQGA